MMPKDLLLAGFWRKTFPNTSGPVSILQRLIFSRRSILPICLARPRSIGFSWPPKRLSLFLWPKTTKTFGLIPLCQMPKDFRPWTATSASCELGHNLECQAHAEPALARSRDEADASRRGNSRLV